MTLRSGATAKKTPAKKAAAKKATARVAAKSQAEIRAEVEAEIRAELEAKIRLEIETAAEQAREQAELARDAAEVRPVSGFEISGDPTQEGALTIHFVDDGLTILGKVWYRGEELILNPGTKQWAESLVGGKPFAAMDEFEQEARWGRRFFRPGPWRGLRIDQIDDPDFTPEQREQLKKAAQIRDERFGAPAL